MASLAPPAAAAGRRALRATSVQTRLLTLILVAAVPLFVMAASIAWQNARAVARQPRDQAALLLSAAAARNDAVLDQAMRLLAGLAAQPLDRATCVATLAQQLPLQAGRIRRLAMLDATGQETCSSGLPSEEPQAAGRVLAMVRDSAGFAVGAVAPGPIAGRPVLTVAAPAVRSGRFAGAVVAELQIDWLAVPAPAHAAAAAGAAWLVTPAAASKASGAAPDASLFAVGDATQPAPSRDAQPAPGRLATLLRPGDGAQVAPSRGGAAYAYDAATLAGGAVLLVGVPAGPAIARADAVLGRRLAELGLLLLAGLAAVAFGAERLVVRPIVSFSRAVRVWRDGGRFDPGPPRWAPAEIEELARTFGRAAAALQARETELRAAVRRQDLLIQEIHHRVKNNLQIVASLLNLQAARIRQPEARAEFQSARNRIRALATLHRHLYAHDEVQTLNMRAFLGELCDQLLQAIGETPQGGRIALAIEAPALRISSDQAVPMALIVTEAVSNAAKYAFPGGRSGHIGVRLRALGADGENRARLEIEDDGVGMAPDGAEHPEGERDGLGLQLIRGFARQLGATLTVTHEAGTHYTIDLPLRPPASSASETAPEAEPSATEGGLVR